MHVMFPIVHDMCLLPQMEDSTQLHGMNSGAFLTSAGAATRTL